MKRIFIILVFISILSLNLFAEPISIQTARQVVHSFLTKPVTATGILKMNQQQSSLTLVYEADSLKLGSVNQFMPNKMPVVPFYVFGIENQGYVIVSGDDRVIPILGFSEEGFFDPNNIPPNMQKWFEGYKAEIRYAVENNIAATPELQAEWQALKSGINTKSQILSSYVAPLIVTKWDQSPYYNGLCPYDNTSRERAVTGCVATAMAQVMNFWDYPIKGNGFYSYNHSSYGTLSANFGSTTFNWASMPSQLTSSSTSTQKNAVATLMYQCGVSVEMDYGVASSGGSSAYVITSESPVTNCTEYALKKYFGYKSSLRGVNKTNYTNTNWINLIKTELDAGRPIIYAGFGDGGHCFVCDGYNNNNFFHFNWGWGGKSDGYFALTALNPDSGGVGGGSYVFTNNQQALIGIEPAVQESTSKTVDLQLYSNLSMTNTNVWFTDAFSVSLDIANFGTGSFVGQLGVAVFDSSLNFVDFVETKSNITLSANSHFQNGLTFSNAGSVAFVPGIYYAAVFYKTATQDWTIIADGDFSNLILFEIYYTSDIETNSAFTIKLNEGKLIQGQTSTVNIDAVNRGNNTFYGKVRVSLANLDGTWAQNIEVIDENEGLQPGYHYIDGVDFNGEVTVKPGTYLLELAYQSKGSSSWYYAGSTNFLNPIYVIVEASSVLTDIYENNDLQSKAYNLTVNFSGNNAIRSTNNSTLHVGTDIDYYKIILPQGFDYTITPRLHDKFSSGNGQKYTVDALFSYSQNGTTYSETYDDIMKSNIEKNNGGTLLFKVTPYFSGSTGTYLLDLNITRKLLNSVEVVKENDQIFIYPNPAKGFAVIDFKSIKSKVTQIDLYNIQGARIFSEEVTGFEKTFNLNLTSVLDGIYFVQIISDKGILSKKIIVKK